MLGGFGIVINTEFAAEGCGGFRPFGIGEGPTRDTGFVNALVAVIAVAGVPEPVPVIGETLLVIGAHGGGTKK